jgi:hypothetical protein
MPTLSRGSPSNARLPVGGIIRDPGYVSRPIKVPEIKISTPPGATLLVSFASASSMPLPSGDHPTDLSTLWYRYAPRNARNRRIAAPTSRRDGHPGVPRRLRQRWNRSLFSELMGAFAIERGIERHLLVDTRGLVIEARVQSAQIGTRRASGYCCISPCAIACPTTQKPSSTLPGAA